MLDKRLLPILQLWDDNHSTLQTPYIALVVISGTEVDFVLYIDQGRLMTLSVDQAISIGLNLDQARTINLNL